MAISKRWAAVEFDGRPPFVVVTSVGYGVWLTNSRRLGEPLPRPATTPVVASATSLSRTCCGVHVGCADTMMAAAPVTCGAAIEVPEIMFVAVSLLTQAEVMATPGANRSRQRPLFENEARLSLMSVAPTVIASATRAGVCWHALAFELPAESEYVTPEAIELRTALSVAVSGPPPRLMFATAGLIEFPVTQSIPAITCAKVPLPEQSRTRTATSETPLATPNEVPPTVPATCVPCPLQSSAAPPSTASKPVVARPPKST